jgi:hypothetical protein
MGGGTITYTARSELTHEQQYQQMYYQKRKDVLLDRQKQYYQENREEKLEYARAYYKKKRAQNKPNAQP